MNPPPPPLWAPRFRRHLMAWLTRMDRREARRLLAKQSSAREVQWLRAYRAWWDEWGWAEGFPTADQVRAERSRDRAYDPRNHNTVIRPVKTRP